MDARRRIAHFLAFTSVGAVATGIHYMVLIVGVQLLRRDAVTASTAGFLISALVNYALNRRYTFRSTKRHSEAIMKFFTVALVGLLLNAIILAIGTQALDLHYIVAQLVATALVLIWNYSLNAAWAFSDSR